MVHPCKKLPQFATCQTPSAGTTTRNTYKMTGGSGLHNTDSCYLEDGEGVKAEWPLLISAVFDVFSKDFENVNWKQIHRRFGKEYAQALGLFDLILTIPATSMACERGFSLMKPIKSDRRTLMSEKTLSNSLMIKLEGPTIQEFNPDRAIELWFNKWERRLGTSGTKENKQDVQEATDSLNVTDEADKEIEVGNVEAAENGNSEVVAQSPGYELVQQSNDSAYKSDYISDDEDPDEIFDKIAQY